MVLSRVKQTNSSIIIYVTDCKTQAACAGGDWLLHLNARQLLFLTLTMISTKIVKKINGLVHFQ